MYHQQPRWVDGPAFGTWTDPTSQLIYHDALPALLSGVPRGDTVLDLGGSNGISRSYFHNVTTVDLDATADPDVVADVRYYAPDEEFDRVLLRYVLHYLSDPDVIVLLRHIAGYHRGPVHLIQFVGDPRVKGDASPDREVRYFRREHDVLRLVELAGYQVTRRIALEYRVGDDFYLNRLGVAAPGHEETTVSLTLERP